MTRTITFNELRKIKDSLPNGAMSKIAEELGMKEQDVRNYFGGENFKSGQSVGFHIDTGPDGGLVMLDDDTILNAAKKMIEQ